MRNFTKRKTFHISVAVLAIVAGTIFSKIAWNTPAQPNENKTPSSDKQTTDTSYNVKVSVREIKNRIVEGQVRQHTIRVDQPKAFGADDTAPTPPEMLAFALGSCVVSTGRLLAMQKQLSIRHITATVEGRLDFAKALGLPTSKRAGYKGLTIRVHLDSDMSGKEKEAFIEEIQSKCPMCDNLEHPTGLKIELAKMPKAGR
ncbi:MAG: OsmC family protein [Deltaproteobacteria bacterium]|nr:OsmC family protein [Deltaproteobacteria bacterium]